MIDEKKLTEYIREKCIEVRNKKNDVDFAKAHFVRQADEIGEGNNFHLASISAEAERLHDLSSQYFEMQFGIFQLCHVLGDEYLEIYKDICGESTK